MQLCFSPVQLVHQVIDVKRAELRLVGLHGLDGELGDLLDQGGDGAVHGDVGGAEDGREGGPETLDPGLNHDFQTFVKYSLQIISK